MRLILAIAPRQFPVRRKQLQVILLQQTAILLSGRVSRCCVSGCRGIGCDGCRGVGGGFMKISRYYVKSTRKPALTGSGVIYYSSTSPTPPTPLLPYFPTSLLPTPSSANPVDFALEFFELTT